MAKIFALCVTYDEHVGEDNQWSFFLRNIYGSSVNHDDYFLIESNSTTSNDSHHEHIISLVEARERIIKIAQENQQDHDIYVIAERS